MKLLTVLSGYHYLRITQYNLVIWFDGSSDNKLRKWNGYISTEGLKQITKENHEIIIYTYK